MEASSAGDGADRPRKKGKLKFRPKVLAKRPKRAATDAKAQQEELKPVDEELLRILRTPKTTRKSAANANDGRSPLNNPPMTLSPATGGDLSSQTSGCEQIRLKKQPISPAMGNPGTLCSDDDDDDNDDDEDDELEEPLPSSTGCEASINPASELNLLKENSTDRMLLFQFPKSLPLPSKSAVAERKGKAAGKETKKGCNLQELPPGFLGKMLVYKSGKIKMKLGDTLFDVNSGVEYDRQQHAAAINTKEKHCCVLGEIEKRHAVVTPDVDFLLKDDLD